MRHFRFTKPKTISSATVKSALIISPFESIACPRFSLPPVGRPRSWGGSSDDRTPTAEPCRPLCRHLQTGPVSTKGREEAHARLGGRRPPPGGGSRGGAD